MLALVNLHQGEVKVSKAITREVLESPHARETSRVFLIAEEILGDIALEEGEATAALEKYDQVLLKATAFAPRGDIVAELRRRRAECYYLMGRLEEARAEAQLGLEHCRELGDRYEEASTYVIAAQSAAALGRAEEARKLFEQGFALFEDIETPYEWGRLGLAYGDWLVSDAAGPYQDQQRALEAYHAAQDRFEAMGAKARLADAETRIARLTEKSSLVATPSTTSSRPRRPTSREVARKSAWALDRFGIVTGHQAMFELLDMVERLARSRAPVLILGESGTGKELIAHALHRLSGRKGEYMAINCAALPREVIESELFGHVVGAFSGAVRDKPGLLEVCQGGTVFLDEISEMSRELQTRLLRFLEGGEVRRVGATRVTKVNPRVVAASNRDGNALRSGERLRRDLYYRLAHTVVELPSLRLRGPQEIELLARHFLELECKEEGKRVELSDAALERLQSHSWPGNVRELKATMMQRVVLAHDDQIRAEDLRFEDDGQTPGTLGAELAQAERRRIEEALRLSRGSKSDAARTLGIPRTTLIGRMRRLGISSD